MATTMKLIAKNVLDTAASSVSFSSIPGTYTDLLLVASMRSNRSGQTISDSVVRVNSDSGTNYSYRRLVGSGSAATSDTGTSQDHVYLSIIPGPTGTASTFASAELYVPNYAGSTNKSFSATGVEERNSTTAFMYATAALWSNTSAITSLTVVDTLAQFVSGSSFFLYGITRA